MPVINEFDRVCAELRELPTFIGSERIKVCLEAADLIEELQRRLIAMCDTHYVCLLMYGEPDENGHKRLKLDYSLLKEGGDT
jgi:hypothetical protein